MWCTNKCVRYNVFDLKNVDVVSLKRNILCVKNSAKVQIESTVTRSSDFRGQACLTGFENV